jgi:ankyrin repeat protein
MSSHSRQTSEPLSFPLASLNLDDTVERGNEIADASVASGRREMFHRTKSARVGPTLPTLNSIGSREPSIDFAALQESWTNSSAGGFLGTSFSSASVHPLRQSSVPASFGGFGTTLESASFHRSVSSPSGGPKTDSKGVSSVIHDAARITDWSTVLELCESRPEAASYAGRDGWTALHHACNRRCPRADVVEALIRAYPAALLQEEEKSWLPLHYACRFKAPTDVVRLLLHMYPESGRIAVEARDKQGRTPLYYAVRYDAPQGVAGLLIHVDPSAVLEEDQHEESPLALVWDSWAEKLEGKRIVHSFLPGGFPESQELTVEERAVILRERLEKEPKLKKRWNQVNMLLKAAFGFPFEEMQRETREDSVNASCLSQQEERRWRIVHATAAVKCHLSLFLLACALHPEQARELDECDLRRPHSNGAIVANPPEPRSSRQTALHLAASSNAGGEPGKTVALTLLSLHRDAAQVPDGVDGSLPLHLMVENPRKQDWPNHAAILYRFYPRAIQMPDHFGKLPLHRAARAIAHADHEGDEERSVVIQLVRTFPQAASHLDESGCLPFHYLAMHARAWDDVVESVHNANRNSVQVRSGSSFNGRLPLQLAAASASSQESLIHRLVQLHPRAAAQEEREGKLALHLVCEQGKAWDAGTRSIYEAYPNAVRQPERNSRGWLPLHMVAASPNSNAELIAKITDLHPEAAMVPDSEGRFALHLACSAGKDWQGGLQTIFDANPNALAARDSQGLLPVHICALSVCRKEGRGKSKTKATPKVEAKKETTLNTEEAAQLDILFNLFRSDPTTIG